MTFSIVGCDLRSGSWGVAVASKYLAVGSVVPVAESGVGALATQGRGNMAYRHSGLVMLRSGRGAADTIAALVQADEGRDERQVGVVDGSGVAATWTGPKCHGFAGGKVADGCAVQGNFVCGPEVIDAMLEVWRDSDRALPLEHRLLDAVAAGDAAGGDARGRQAAALVVARRGSTYHVGSDVDVDLRVDDSTQPIKELQRLLELRYQPDAS